MKSLIYAAKVLGFVALGSFFGFGVFLILCAWARELYWLCGGN